MKKTIVLLAALLSAAGFSAFAQETQKPEYGYKVSDFVSKPKFGGYIIGGYKYSDQEGAHGGPWVQLPADPSVCGRKHLQRFQVTASSSR